MLAITTATCSDRGQRAANEDALRVGIAGARQYAVLSDGAGGHARGAQASRCVVEHIEAALQPATGLSFAPDRLTSILLAAHTELQHRQRGERGHRRMHATVVVLWLDTRSHRAIWSHVGDSRLYRFRAGAADLVTADDSVVQRLLEGGMLTPQQAQDHPLKNQLLAAMGMQDEMEPHTPANDAAVEAGDAFLLCTDGWWGALKDTEMTGTLGDAATPQAWLDAMRRLIETRCAPGQDNFSAVAVWAADVADTADGDTTVAMALSGP